MNRIRITIIPEWTTTTQRPFIWVGLHWKTHFFDDSRVRIHGQKKGYALSITE